MKKFLVCFVVFAAMFLMISCGGEDDDDNGGYSGSSSLSECDDLEDFLFKCSNSARYICYDGSWHFIEDCPYGCDYSLPICNTNSEGNSSSDSQDSGSSESSGSSSSSNGGSSSECSDGDYKCNNHGNYEYSYKCSNGNWESMYDKICFAGCNSSTGRCNSCEHSVHPSMWSTPVSDLSWYDAVSWCENLEEKGYSDWRLPTISELRTLIQNCPASEVGGECEVSDICLAGTIDLWCDGCDAGAQYYCKYGKHNYFYSSSRANSDRQYWTVNCNSGSIVPHFITDNNGNELGSSDDAVICVR